MCIRDRVNTQYQVKCTLPSVDRFDEFVQREEVAIDVKYKTDSMNFWLILANWLPLILDVYTRQLL